MNRYPIDYSYLQYSGSPTLAGLDEDGTHYSDGEGSYPPGGLAHDHLDLIWHHALDEDDFSEMPQSYPLSRGPSSSTTMSNFPSSPMAGSVDSFTNGYVVDSNSLEEAPQQPLPCSFDNNNNNTTLVDAQTIAMNANYYGAGHHAANSGFNSGTTSPDFGVFGSFEDSWNFTNTQTSYRQVRSPPTSNPQYGASLGQVQHLQIPQTMITQPTSSQEQWDTMSNEETVVGLNHPMAYSPPYWPDTSAGNIAASNVSTARPQAQWPGNSPSNSGTSTAHSHSHSHSHAQPRSRRLTRRASSPRKRETTYACNVSGCHAKPFGRRADLDRHHKQIHCPDNEKEAFHCDYPKCSRASSAFSRRDHFRDHYRGFHREDVEKRGVVDSRSWYNDRSTYKKWWRCSKCLHRVYIDKHGFVCFSCGGECTQIRRDIRNLLP